MAFNFKKNEERVNHSCGFWGLAIYTHLLVQGLLHQANCLGATYLFQQDKFYDVNFDTGDKSIQCGRKGDALKLWLTFKIHGMDVIERRINAAFEASKLVSYIVVKI